MSISNQIKIFEFYPKTAGNQKRWLILTLTPPMNEGFLTYFLTGFRRKLCHKNLGLTFKVIDLCFAHGICAGYRYYRTGALSLDAYTHALMRGVA